ncbi:2-oxoacid:acceptor oxidoreductase family protein [Clostridium sp. Cult2]|uniref:2-oxoacid:acceptor oxidoreductase family protein n=1 Tax=Clostridium sp. Cult2 TaxID=2079003 RepID=UPI001F34DABD|nr:2-oxoacid:acceptor oxidoreductase family protein [Clostridium sp. Cult2]MCF6465565.1 2-oxoglutarate synthase [Clostridium sp. Cult2]
MSKTCQIILSGVGGQGLVSSGTILGESATIYEDKNATLVTSYGVETRGTFTKSDVIISDGDISYPEVSKPDIVLALAQVAYDKYVSELDEDSILVYDCSLIKDTKESKGKQFGYPINDIALELGNVAVANVIAVGIIIQKTGILKKESIIEAIKDRFASKPKVIDLNIEALERGIKIGMEA